jgi:DNA repair protein SbcD/Mre11
MSFKFIHTADIHLDSPLRGLERYEGAPVEEMRRATRQALQKLVQLALDEAVAFVVIAGDVYDGDWKDYGTGLFFVQQMLRLREARIPVVAIHGNHDAENRMTRLLDMRDSVRVLSARKPETVRAAELAIQANVTFHGQSFATAAILENLVPHYPSADRNAFNIGLLHTCLTGEGHDPYAPCTPQDLRGKGYDYWALGHIHTRNDGAFSDPPIVFPGNIQGRHIREQGAKGCVIVSVDGQNKATVEFRALDVLRWVHCEIPAGGAASPDDLLEKFAADLHGKLREHDGLPLAVRVTLKGDCLAHKQLAAAPERWTNEIRSTAIDISGGAAWVEKVLIRTSLPRPDRNALGDGPLDELLRTLRDIEGDEAALACLSEELSDLRRKLPTELTDGEDSLNLDDPVRLREFLSEIEPLLLARIGAREDAA